MTPHTPSLHVLFRPDAPRAVLLRQGPSKVYCSLGWDLTTDQVTVGQWVKHKIYIERCDLSADGNWLLYFALNGAWKSETRGSWTAVSRVPYLKAVKLWPQGDTWGGGGMLVADPTELAPVWRHRWDAMERADDRARIHWLGQRQDRMLRAGWQTGRTTGLIKPVTAGWHLRFRGRRKPIYALVDGHGVAHDRRWDWADVDARRRRVIFTEAGVLSAAPIDAANGHGPPEVLFDARGMTFEPLVAPYTTPTIIVGKPSG